MKKPKKTNNLLLLACIANVILITCVIFGIRFTHPQLTEIELFFKFWYIWFFCAIDLGITLKLLNDKSS